MGVIAKQSGFALIALGAGLVIGAANNMIVLPRAFEGREAIWGLVRIMTSWGLIVGSLSTLGAPGAIVRFLNQFPESERGKVLNSILAIAAFGLACTLTALVIWGEDWIAWFDPNNSELLQGHAVFFLLMIGIMSMLHIFRSLLTLSFQTGYMSWVDELWQKASYIGLGVLLILDWITLEAFVPLYVGSWGVSLILMSLPSWRYFRNFSFGLNFREIPTFLEYSGYSLLAGGAVLIANQLDYIMVGKYLGLEEVPIYTLGFFIGSVVAIPGRATVNIVQGVIASKISRSDTESIGLLTKNTARINVLLMSTLMAGIWAGFDPFQNLLPENFRGLENVFLCIGSAKIISGLNNSNNQYLSLSKHYRLVLPINLALLVITIAMNYVFLVIFEWGLTGAALATLGTFIWNNAWRLVIVHRKLQVHPFTWSIPIILAIATAAAVAFKWDAGTLGFHPLIEAIIQGGLASGTVFIACYALGFFPELRTGIKQRLPWWP